MKRMEIVMFKKMAILTRSKDASLWLIKGEPEAVEQMIAVER